MFEPEIQELLKLMAERGRARVIAYGTYDHSPYDAGEKVASRDEIVVEAWVWACKQRGVNRPYLTVYGTYVRTTLFDSIFCLMFAAVWQPGYIVSKSVENQYQAGDRPTVQVFGRYPWEKYHGAGQAVARPLSLWGTYVSKLLIDYTPNCWTYRIRKTRNTPSKIHFWSRPAVPSLLKVRYSGQSSTRSTSTHFPPVLLPTSSQLWVCHCLVECCADACLGVEPHHICISWWSIYKGW